MPLLVRSGIHRFVSCVLTAVLALLACFIFPIAPIVASATVRFAVLQLSVLLASSRSVFWIVKIALLTFSTRPISMRLLIPISLWKSAQNAPVTRPNLTSCNSRTKLLACDRTWLRLCLTLKGLWHLWCCARIMYEFPEIVFFSLNKLEILSENAVQLEEDSKKLMEAAIALKNYYANDGVAESARYATLLSLVFICLSCLHSVTW